MFRPSNCILLLTLAAGFCLPTGSTLCGQSDELVGSSVSVEVADLKQQLEKGLRARRPQEFKFIATVVNMVEGDQLPLDLVKSTFAWARRKGFTTRYPFPYFESALRLRAAKKGIKIP